MADSIEEIQSAKKKYIAVFGALLVGTILTVLVASPPDFLYWLDIGDHGFDHMDGILGLLIASTKATLVAYVFMHLNHEKKLIYWVFFSSLALVASMAILLVLGYRSEIIDKFFY
ncbi:MAG: cytochrome C oxidase subunit IV family protein [Luteolibacter sp.]